MDEFTTCVKDFTYREEVMQDLQDGLTAGVRGTPSFRINGKMLFGAQSYSVFQQEIETTLSAINSP